MKSHASETAPWIFGQADSTAFLTSSLVLYSAARAATTATIPAIARPTGPPATAMSAAPSALIPPATAAIFAIPATTGSISANAPTAATTAGAIVSNAALRPSSAPVGSASAIPENATLMASMPVEITSFAPLMMVAMDSPIVLNCDVNPLMAPDMLFAPIASMTDCSALEMRFGMLAIAVPMPCVESLACCAKDAKESPPSLSSVIIMALNSLMDTVPFLSALKRSLLEDPAPRSAVAIWLSCPGMTSWSVRQSWSSGLPLDSIWLYCCIARLTSAVDAPDARHMSLNAMPMLVASSRLEQSGASCCTMPVSAGSDVGRPSIAPLILWMDAVASSPEYPRFCMTFGKLFIVSTRLIALPSDDDIALIAELVTLDTTPAIAPAFAENFVEYSSPHFAPACEPTFAAPENAPLSCSLMLPLRLSNFGVRRTEPLATSGNSNHLSFAFFVAARREQQRAHALLVDVQAALLLFPRLRARYRLGLPALASAQPVGDVRELVCDEREDVIAHFPSQLGV